MRWILDPDHTRIGFAVQHMGITFATGQFTQYTSVIELDERDPERSTIAITIDAASASTGNLERDAHLRSPDFFDVSVWPTIQYRSGVITPLGFDTYNIEGELTIRGVTRPVTLEAIFGGATVDPGGERRAGFSMRGRIRRGDYGLTWNAPLENGGMVLGQSVRLEIEAELVERSEGHG